MEISHTLTDNIKWDGLELPVRNHSAASVVSEFAGGIHVGTLAKKTSDEIKMATNARKVVYPNAAFTKKLDRAKVHCLLYYDMNLSMDILITLPQTEADLKKFASQLELLSQWRDTVVKHADALQKED
ncbi:hypothetical protein BDB00DRAFT_872454 [Zychaea mexicana]|uniref:uncharacterized protein n=1 Tax=Zychaea mexicana TaxID=64656 RepID=UPI0022FDDC16|nr:uncharacterized protein BDB00DRAFT_872454 [Zychaea mexicana]KAI9493348.1 hypothetical protein BDB00DRAFT_872454 [Zychaea mexicana]